MKTELEIVFVSYDTPIARAIQGFTQSKWGHVGVITRRENGIVQIHEAQRQGLIKSTFDEQVVEEHLKLGNWEIKTIEVDMSLEQIEKRANSYVGRPYGYATLGLIFLFRYTPLIDTLIKKLFNKDINSRSIILQFSGPRQLICSEFVARLLYDASYKTINFEEEYNKSYDLITPADIYNSKIYMLQELVKNTLEVDKL